MVSRLALNLVFAHIQKRGRGDYIGGEIEDHCGEWVAVRSHTRRLDRSSSS